MRNQVSLEFLNWFLALLEDYLSQQEVDELQGRESSTLAPRIYGQIGQTSLTGRQSNLTVRPGQPLTTVLIGGSRVAIGDTKKQYTRPLLSPRNSPVVVLPLSYQPAVLPSNPAFLRALHNVKGAAEPFTSLVDHQTFDIYYERLYKERAYFDNGVLGYETLSEDAGIVEPVEWLGEYDDYTYFNDPIPREGPYMSYGTSPVEYDQTGWEQNVWEQYQSRLTNVPSPVYYSNYDTSETGRLIVRDFPAAESFMMTCDIEPLSYTEYATRPDSQVLADLNQNTFESYYEDLPQGDRVILVGADGDTKTVGPIELEFSSVTDRWRYLGSPLSDPKSNDNGATFTRPKATWNRIDEYPDNYLERAADVTLPAESAYVLWGSGFYGRPNLDVYPDDASASANRFNPVVTPYEPFYSNVIYVIGYVEKGMLLRFGRDLFWAVDVNYSSQDVTEVTLDRASDWSSGMTGSAPLITRKDPDGFQALRYKITERVLYNGKGVWLSRLKVDATRYEVQLEPGAELYRNSHVLLQRQKTDTAYPDEWSYYAFDPSYGYYRWVDPSADPPPIMDYWLSVGDDFAVSAPKGETLLSSAGTLGKGRLPINFKWTPADLRTGQYEADHLIFNTGIDASDIGDRNPRTGDKMNDDSYIWWPTYFSQTFYHGPSYIDIFERQAWFGPLSPRAQDAGFTVPALTETLSPETQAEIDKYIPYIYDETIPDPTKSNKLAHPFGTPRESTWYGITFTAQWYAADVFKQLVPELENGVSALNEHTFAVAIAEEGGAYNVYISRDEVQLGIWDVFAFFPPTSDGELRFLDGSPWPPVGKAALKPIYEWTAHPYDYDPNAGALVPIGEWPQLRDGCLPPFSARLRTSQDKNAPEGCPLVLYLDSP